MIFLLGFKIEKYPFYLFEIEKEKKMKLWECNNIDFIYYIYFSQDIGFINWNFDNLQDKLNK